MVRASARISSLACAYLQRGSRHAPVWIRDLQIFVRDRSGNGFNSSSNAGRRAARRTTRGRRTRLTRQPNRVLRLSETSVPTRRSRCTLMCQNHPICHACAGVEDTLNNAIGLIRQPSHNDKVMFAHSGQWRDCSKALTSRATCNLHQFPLSQQHHPQEAGRQARCEKERKQQGSQAHVLAIRWLARPDGLGTRPERAALSAL